MGRPWRRVGLGESVAQAAVRETREESGIECVITGIVGIYSDPRHVILYTSNGKARQEFSTVLGGSNRLSSTAFSSPPADAQGDLTGAAQHLREGLTLAAEAGDEPSAAYYPRRWRRDSRLPGIPPVQPRDREGNRVRDL